MENRILVLKDALQIEDTISLFISKLLNIENHLTSRSFCNGQQSLSLNSKILLLTDLGALDSEDIKIFQWFMEIRNQFMHNYHLNTFKEFFEYNKSNMLGIQKRFKMNIENEEDELRKLYFRLVEEVFLLIKKIQDKIHLKLINDAENEVNRRMKDIIFKCIDDMQLGLNYFGVELIKRGETFNKESLQILGDWVAEKLRKSIVEEIRTSKN